MKNIILTILFAVAPAFAQIRPVPPPSLPPLPSAPPSITPPLPSPKEMQDLIENLLTQIKELRLKPKTPETAFQLELLEGLLGALQGLYLDLVSEAPEFLPIMSPKVLEGYAITTISGIRVGVASPSILEGDQYVKELRLPYERKITTRLSDIDRLVESAKLRFAVADVRDSITGFVEYTNRFERTLYAGSSDFQLVRRGNGWLPPSWAEDIKLSFVAGAVEISYPRAERAQIILHGESGATKSSELPIGRQNGRTYLSIPVSATAENPTVAVDIRKLDGTLETRIYSARDGGRLMPVTLASTDGFRVSYENLIPIENRPIRLLVTDNPFAYPEVERGLLTPVSGEFLIVAHYTTQFRPGISVGVPVPGTRGNTIQESPLGFWVMDEKSLQWDFTDNAKISNLLNTLDPGTYYLVPVWEKFGKYPSTSIPVPVTTPVPELR